MFPGYKALRLIQNRDKNKNKNQCGGSSLRSE